MIVAVRWLHQKKNTIGRMVFVLNVNMVVCIAVAQQRAPKKRYAPLAVRNTAISPSIFLTQMMVTAQPISLALYAVR